MKSSPQEVRSYIYLDEAGINSLYAQTMDELETEQITTLEDAVNAKGGLAIRFKNTVIKLLGGPDLEASGEISGSRKRIRQSKSTQTVEQKLLHLVAALQKIGDPVLFTDLPKAAASTGKSRKKVFICIEDEFNAPQFFAGGGGAQNVNLTGYLILEKGGPRDYDPRDEYYRHQLNLPLTLAVNVTKLRRGTGTMPSMGHDALFFRGFEGRRVPLCVFGTLGATSLYYQIKPYAIWLP